MTTLEREEKPSNPLVQLSEREEFPTLVTITLEGGSGGTGEEGLRPNGVSHSQFDFSCGHIPKAPHI